MCNDSCLDFGRRALTAREIRGKRVLETGARDVNGSLRALVERLGPARYVGVDIAAGRGVDVICRVEDLERRFGRDSFDVVIATELLEHVRNWRAAVSCMKRVCAPGGVIVVTTRSRGFPYHGFPFDFWRYEVEEMRQIFGDCVIEILERDPSAPGVFLKARKAAGFVEETPNDLALYCVIKGRRLRSVSIGGCLSPRILGRMCVLAYWDHVSPRIPAGLRRMLRRARCLLAPSAGRLFSEQEDV